MKKLIVCLAVMAVSGTRAQDTISKADIPVAAKLIDLQFTEREIDSMYAGVRDIVRNIHRMHQHSLNNSVPMSLWQNPVLPGMTFDTKQQPINWNIPSKVELPRNGDELAYYSVLQLASLIKNKKISSVGLTNFFLDRIEKFDDSLHAVITVTREIAMEQARQADAEIAKGKYRGPLHGIPYGLKDLFAVKGTKTTWGAAPYKEQVIGEDAYVYTRLREAGAVLIAKFTLGALAMGDKWFGGRTNNPWNLQYGSSGSSAGSASATVAGLVPFAIGTETLGSIISPSNVCGATGLRPTFGRVSRTGAMTLSWSLDKVGPICRTAEDAAVVFAYIHGTDGKDASAVNMPFNYKPVTDIRKLKIGYAKNYFDRTTDTSRSEWKVLKAFKDMGVKVDPVVFPDSGVYNFNIVGIVIGAEAAAAFDEFTRKNIDDEMTWQNRGDWPNYFRTARFYSAVDYINANRHRYLLMQEVNKLFSQYDVIITPTYAGGQLAITNLTGHPAMSLPTGFNPRTKLPTSITFLGKLYGEANLLAVAKAFQQATPHEDAHPFPFYAVADGSGNAQPGLNTDSIQIRKTVMDFYRWYNTSWKKVDAFQLFRSKKGNDGPPYMIDWKVVDQYFTYLRRNVPTVGEAFIENERRFFQDADEAFKNDPDEEMPAGFDYDRFTNSQEEPQWFWDELIKPSNVWTIVIDKTDADKGYVIIQQRDQTQTSVLHHFFCGELQREKGKWKIARLDCEVTKDESTD